MQKSLFSDFRTSLLRFLTGVCFVVPAGAQAEGAGEERGEDAQQGRARRRLQRAL